MTTQIRPIRTVLALALAFAAAASAPSALAATTTATAAGKIIAPIAISKTTDLSFGNFSIGTGAGTVVLGTGGTRSVTGTVTLAGGTPTVATFNITGEAGLGFTVDYAGTSATLTNGGSSIAFAAVSDFNGGGAATDTAGTGTLTAGAQTLYVGGTLTLVGGEATGDYTGTVSATVQYN